MCRFWPRSVVLKYETGYDTKLTNHPRLYDMIETLGPPTEIRGWVAVWGSVRGCIIPKTIETHRYEIQNPYPNHEHRTLISLGLDP